MGRYLLRFLLFCFIYATRRSLLATLLGEDRAERYRDVLVSELGSHITVRLPLAAALLEGAERLIERVHRATDKDVDVASALALGGELQDGEVAPLRDLLVLDKVTVRLKYEMLLGLAVHRGLIHMKANTRRAQDGLLGHLLRRADLQIERFVRCRRDRNVALKVIINKCLNAVHLAALENVINADARTA